MNTKRPKPKYIIVKIVEMKDKKRILKAQDKKRVTYKGALLKLSAYFSAETLQAKREWCDIFKGPKGKNL